MKSLKVWTLQAQEKGYVELLVEGRHLFRIHILEDGLARVLLMRAGTLALDRTWSIAPREDVAWEGRARESLADFSLPTYRVEEGQDRLVLTTKKLRITVHQPLWLQWEYHDGQDWRPLVSDRPTGAYLLDAHGEGLEHYQLRAPEHRYYGLGEKTGDLNRAGKRFEMRNLDAMGYDAASTDPLYKHIPFVITHQEHASFGMFYDNLNTSLFDLGNELDNYHRPYRRYKADAGDLDYWVLAGPRVLDVTKAFVRLTGRTLFLPKWSLGYSGSTMRYTDADNAQEQLLEFLDLCRQHDIPCDSFQLSSGYTSIGEKRYVFNWNREKVPDPKALAQAYRDAGVRLIANIKPCLLQDHPRYAEVAHQKMFIGDSEHDMPERSVFWDDEGSHLDFTNPDAVGWWQSNVTSQLLELGIECTWNDNNEFEVWDGEARCHGFGREIAIKHIRPVMALLMMRASLEAQQRFSPSERPYLISRSGCAGMQRYVQTWSGDNRTHWKTLRYNTRMGLGMSLSGLYNVGHDVGGFSGNKPDPELFVRWVQNGVMHPRFTIHSWNDDGTVNEPWMHPSVTDAVRDAIRLRYRLMPYFYTLLWQASHEDEPILRPTFLDHEHDPQTFKENDEFLLGRDVLVASVVEQGAREREVWLPLNTTGWCDWHTGDWYEGGQYVSLDAPLERLPLLVRGGAAIPTGECHKLNDPALDRRRELVIFPAPSGTSSGVLFEDDGISHEWKDGGCLVIRWTVEYGPDFIDLTIAKTGDFRPAWEQLGVALKVADGRALRVNGHGGCTLTLVDIPEHRPLH
ncbi:MULTISPECIES: glycoside hydrolase family 31 protein [Pseudomonas]|uniref:glycoside hydrolase family 31 protein n=1 Tax=Pseudomonas TaxID=286 RepID=UPI0018E7357C|nr:MULTISPECIES: glycoside hydrolase family 31 protein [Pseudomonas]MBJ2346927.1 glycoside hydrolase family 31 protein [Pseudomonas canavaninivorans]MBL3542799.1 glycoside hydrolase family 31 protein [Pseudomonas sp. HB05]